MGGSTDTIRVLHVDDDPAFAEMAAAFLERADDRFDVQTVPSADAGMERLAGADFDCVVSDYDMPGTDGLAFLDAVREAYPDLPFVLFTGKGSEEVASDAISGGATDYLQKKQGTEQYELLANRIGNAVSKHRAEERIAAQERRRVRTLDRITDAFVAFDTDLRFTYVNEAAAEFIGRSSEALVGTAYADVADVTTNDRLLEALGSALAEQETREVVAPSAVRPGRWIEERIYPSETGLSVYFRDVTDRVRRDDALESLHEVAREFLDASDPEAVAEHAVTSARTVLGLPLVGLWLADDGDPATLRPGAVTDAWRDTVGDPRDPSAVDIENLRDVFERGDVVRRDADGSTDGPVSPARWELLLPLGEHGLLIAATTAPDDFDAVDESLVRVFAETVRVALTRADRERRLVATSRRLEAIIENTTMPMFMKNADGEYVLVNRAYRELYDLHDEQVIGRTVHELHAPETVEEIWPNDRAVLERDEPIETEERIVANGEERVFLSSKVPIHDVGTHADPDEPVAVFGVASEITERKGYERKLERQNERLEEFASIVSHDLRSPLNVAEGRLDLAREAEGDRAAADHLDAVERAHDRMGTLIGDLLTVARDGETVDDVGTVDLASVAADCWERLETGGATLAVETGDPIRADESWLRQLLENLLRNSLEHAAGDVTVTVGTLPDDAGFYVADDGPGITAGEREAVFESGYSTAPDGTGFGLSIVRQIAAAHGWDVRVTESDDGGARFEVGSVERA